MNWYVVRCPSPRHAAESLKEQRFESFHAVETRWHHRRSRKVKVERPLFPGYLFVRCTPADFYRVEKVSGVGSFFRYPFNGVDLHPVSFPDEALGDLMFRQLRGEFDATQAGRQRFHPKTGERVKVVGGKWRGYIADVLSITSKTNKATVMLEGMEVKMTLDMAHLDAA